MGNQLNCLAQCHEAREGQQRLVALQKGARTGLDSADMAWTRAVLIERGVVCTRRVLHAQEADPRTECRVGEDPSEAQRR